MTRWEWRREDRGERIEERGGLAFGEEYYGGGNWEGSLSEDRPGYGQFHCDPDDLRIRESRVILSHQDLLVFQLAFSLAQEIFVFTKGFPKEELFGLTDQIRRSSRSTAALIGEAWRRKRYPAAFVNKLSEAEAEAAETQVWLRFSRECGYLVEANENRLYPKYEEVIRMLVAMQNWPELWTRKITRPSK